jgi:hypothetical protein
MGRWPDDVIDCLLDSYNIYCLSAAGDTLKNIALDNVEYADALAGLIDARGLKVSAVLLSAGGNDIVGDELAGYLNENKDGKGTPATLINDVPFNAKFTELARGYTDVIGKIQARWPGIPIVLHTYDYAVPLPKQPFGIIPRDGWVGEPMRGKKIVDPQVRQGIVKTMIDTFHDNLAELAATRFKNVFLVDTRNTVPQTGWNDELHPKDPGFAAVANKFRKVLKGAGVA